jgi:putative pyruvate formate lyase activating enzyme
MLPSNLAGSKKVLEFAAEQLKDCYVNIMPQYRPCGTAYEYEELGRRITATEYLKVIDFARKLGLHREF